MIYDNIIIMQVCDIASSMLRMVALPKIKHPSASFWRATPGQAHVFSILVIEDCTAYKR
jgi:hypothetical protein